MSRFLQNLLARAISPAPAIQPRLASRYESAAGASPSPASATFTEEHIESSSPHSLGSPIPTTGRPAFPPSSLLGPIPPTSDRAPATVTAGRLDVPSAPAPRVPIVDSTFPAPPPAERIQPPVTSPTSRAHMPPPGSVSSAPGFVTSSTPPLFFPHREAKPDPRVPALPSTESSPPPTPSAAPSLAPAAPAIASVSSPAFAHAGQAPTPSVAPVPPVEALPVSAPPAAEPSIRVTIGRVEIRAMPPPSASSRPEPAAPARRPALPLEEYLRRRDAA